MLPGLTLEPATHALSTPFRIARGVRVATEVVVATVSDGAHVGRGESLPYPRYGESVASVIAEATAVADAMAGPDRRRRCDLLRPGAARNALDCALWDLEARRQGVPVAELLGRPGTLPMLASAQTVSLDTPERMARAATALRHLQVVKVKVDANDPASLIRAVRGELPAARLIVDPNESWDIDLLRATCQAEFVDLDGPLWLREDHPGGVVMRDGLLQAPSALLWGGGLPFVAT